MSDHRSSLVAQAYEAAVGECRHLEAEINAFERFIGRVRALPVDDRLTDGGTTPRPAPRTVTRTGDSAPFHDVRAAFRDTVLTVEHWQTAYDESTVAESLAAEFSPALAHLVLNPGTARFTPAVRSQLIDMGDQAIALRQRTLRSLAAEVAELDRLRDELEEVTTRLEEVRAAQAPFATRLESVRQARHRLEQLLATHQGYIHGQPRQRYNALVASVYAALDVEYPGLAGIAAAVAQLEAVELWLWTEMANDEWADDSRRDRVRGDRRRLPERSCTESSS